MYPATIGPGNEFSNIQQAGCAAHVDAIQFYTGDYETITGNYFHDNETGIANYASNVSSPYKVTNNVLVGAFGSGAGGIMVTSRDGCDAEHNTTANPGGGPSLICGAGNGGPPDSTNITILGNVFSGDAVNLDPANGVCASYTATYNDSQGQSITGTGNITGTPIFVSSPASGYYHYELDSSSPGYHAVPGGKSMGIARDAEARWPSSSTSSMSGSSERTQ